MTATGDLAGDRARRPRAVPSSMHVLDSMDPGGAQNVAIDLAGWLVRQGGWSTIVAPPGPLADRLPPGVGFEPLTARALTVAQLARIAARYRPAILHAHQRRQALEAGIVGRLLDIPVVEHAHTVLPSTGLRALSFRSRTVFSVGDNVTRMVTERFDRPVERVVTIGNVPAHRDGPPPTPWRPDPDGPLRLLGIGRLVEQKDPLRFVRVVAAMSREHPVRARWLGDGPLLDEARAAARRLDAPVDVVGASEDVVGELDASDALVMTSRWEGSPLVALEAALRRRAVFSTASSGVDVPPYARSMVVVPDACADDSFARAILSAFGDPDRLRSIIDAAHTHVAHDLVPDRVFAPVLATYRALAAERRAAVDS
jgi:glycosyltransferase involved in cell wall biosynthesis